MGTLIDMDVKVGDIVGIEITVSSYDGRRVYGKGNGGGGGRRSSIRFGRVHWAGPKFVTLEFPQGYKESFFYDQIVRKGKQ
jgi:hypothetical protein